MIEDGRYSKIVEEAVGSMELEGFSPTDEDRQLAYLCISGQMSFEEVLKEIMG